mmetsp:Transcript_116620/g.174130  ORF Transcript_116620/g.174130 Transcript_116620/m.174130 type:complete len:278 (+) Transcript_116620:1219-2052(+)
MQRGVRVVNGPHEAEVQAQPRHLRFDLVQVRASAVAVDRQVDARGLLELLHLVDELAVPLGPQHLSDVVGALLEACRPCSLREVQPDLAVALAHAMHVARHRVGEVLHGVRELDEVMAVSARDPGVQHLPTVSPRRAQRGRDVGVAAAVEEILGVHDSDDEVEDIAPLVARVEPVQMLRLLQHSYVPLVCWHTFCHVSRRNDRPDAVHKLRIIKLDLNVGLVSQLLLNPVPDKGLLLFRSFEDVLRVQGALLVRRDEGDAERHLMTLRGLLEKNGAK